MNPQAAATPLTSFASPLVITASSRWKTAASLSPSSLLFAAESLYHSLSVHAATHSPHTTKRLPPGMPADSGPLQAHVISHLDLVIQLTTDTWGIPASIEFAVSASATLRDNYVLDDRSIA